MAEKRKKARKKKIDPTVFAEAYINNGENATKAFELTRGKNDISPGYAKVGGSMMMKKPEVQSAIELVKEELENHAKSAVKRVGELVQSEDEAIAGQNARFIIEHVKGKPTSHSIQQNINIFEAVNSLVLDAEAPDYVEAEVVDEPAEK